MTGKTFNIKLKQIKDTYKNNLDSLYTEYAFANAKFKIGDTIKYERWTFTVDKMTVYKMFDFPEIVYHGYELRKDLTPRKDKKRVTIYGNVAKLISEGNGN